MGPSAYPPAVQPSFPPPPVVAPAVPPPPDLKTDRPAAGVINPRTGEYNPGTFGGVVDPKTGVVLPKVEGGYANPATGEVIPKKPEEKRP